MKREVLREAADIERRVDAGRERVAFGFTYAYRRKQEGLREAVRAARARKRTDSTGRGAE